MEKFCKDLKELGTGIINLEEKEMIPLTNREIKSYEKQIYVKKSFAMIKIKKANMIFIIKSEIIATAPENLEGLLIIFAI